MDVFSGPKRREIDEFDGLNTELTKQCIVWWENQSEGMAEEIYQHLNHHPFDENIFETINNQNNYN